MEQSSHQPQPMMGAETDAAQIAYGNNPYTPAMVTGAPAVIGAFPCSQPSAGASPYLPVQHQLSYQQVQQFHHQQQQQLQTFWANQMHEIEQTTDFKNHSLPLARIKKIMKADEDVRMISAEAPVVFARACEMFILELTLRSWLHTEESKRRTLQKNDIAAAITRTDIFDFLVDIVPRDDTKEDELGIAGGAQSGIGAPPDSIPYYVVPTQPPGAGPGMVMGKAIDLAAPVPAMYAAGPEVHPMAYFWQQQQPAGQQTQQQQMPEGE